MFGRKTINKLQAEIVTLQHAVNDITSGQDRVSSNPYSTYGEKVKELSAKFNGESDFGNQVCHNVITVRSSFTIGSGVRLAESVAGKGKRELEFIKRVFERNNISAYLAQDFAQEAEIEGKFAASISGAIDEDGIKTQATGLNTIDVRYISWTQHNYTVNTAPKDYMKYKTLQYRINKTGDDVTLKENQFVFRPFGGRISRVNDTPPKLGTILCDFENFDKAYRDLRKINSLHASPTPWFDVQEEGSAESLWNWLKKKTWKIGKILITTNTKFSVVGPDKSGMDSILAEITAIAKLISGATGVPVHFLGLPDLMSNRATAENLMELINASTGNERNIWLSFYQELVRKCLKFANDNFQAGFDLNAVKVSIPFMSSEKLKEIIDIWLPLYSAGTITLKTLLSKIPDIEPDAEEKALEDMQELLKPIDFNKVNEDEPNDKKGNANAA